LDITSPPHAANRVENMEAVIKNKILDRIGNICSRSNSKV
jgi:hypothetical protein